MRSAMHAAIGLDRPASVNAMRIRVSGVAQAESASSNVKLASATRFMCHVPLPAQRIQE